MSTSSTSSDLEMESKKTKKSKLSVDKKTPSSPPKKMKKQIVIPSSSSSSSSDEEMIKKKKKHTKKDDDGEKKKKKKHKKLSDVKDTPHVKTPKKSKKPTQEDMEVEKKKLKKSTKGVDKDDDSDATKTKKSIPKKDQEITVPEMTRLLGRFVDSISEPMISSMKKKNPALFDQFVTLIEPYRSQWLYSTPIGRLFKFVKDKKSKDGGGKFVCITEDPRLMILTNYAKKEDFPLDELYKRYMTKHHPDADHEKTKEGKLFQFLNGNAKMCSEVCMDHKMQQCILHSKDDNKSYWVNSPEGREKLGLVINIKPRKMDEHSIAAEIEKLVRTRSNIVHLLDGGSIDTSPKKSSSKKIVDTAVDDDDSDDAFISTSKSSKKTNKSDEKKITEKEKVVKKNEKKDKKSTNNEKKSSKRKADELESSKSKSSQPTTATKKSKLQHNETKSTPTPKPVRTVVTSVSIDDDMINKIKQMNSNQLRTMLEDEKKKMKAIDKETLERVEWFERYISKDSMMMKAC